jgi:hypothetical protein
MRENLAGRMHSLIRSGGALKVKLGWRSYPFWSDEASLAERVEKILLDGLEPGIALHALVACATVPEKHNQLSCPKPPAWRIFCPFTALCGYVSDNATYSRLLSALIASRTLACTLLHIFLLLMFPFFHNYVTKFMSKFELLMDIYVRTVNISYPEYNLREKK